MGTNETIDQTECHIADSANIAAIHSLLMEHGFTSEPGPEWPGFLKGETRNYYRDGERVFVVDIAEYDSHPRLWVPSTWRDVSLTERLWNGRLGAEMDRFFTALLMTSGEMLAFLHIMYGAL